MVTRVPRPQLLSTVVSAWLAWIGIATVGGSARAQTLALETSGYPGLDPLARCFAIAESPDGRLWFASQDRLQCLDGGTVWDVEFALDGERRGPTGIRCIEAAADGSLWIGAVRGIWHLPPSSPKAVPVPAARGTSVWKLRRAPDGRVFALSQRHLMSLALDGRFDQLPIPPDTFMQGLETTRDALWLWNRHGLFRAEWDTGFPVWQACAADLGEEIQTAGKHGEELLIATATRILRCSGHGPIEVLADGLQLKSPRHLAVGRHGVWLANANELWEMPWAARSVRRVQLYSSGRNVCTGLSSIFCDGQGLLWTGLQQGITRARCLPSIDNFTIDGSASDEKVTALAETPTEELLAGTTNGRLLRGEHTFEPLATPWPAGPGQRTMVIGIVAESADSLVAATMNHGIWRSSAGTWEPLPLHLGQEQCRSLLRRDDELWIATSHRVFRGQVGGWDFEEVPLPATLGGLPTGPAMLASGLQDDLWLASYRGGLLRFDPRSAHFQPWDNDDSNPTVLAVLALERLGMWMVAADGLWQVDRASGAKWLRQPVARSANFHALASDDRHGIWLTTTNQLAHFDPATSRAQLLSPRQGAHPLGYGWRNSLIRRNGEIWFGAGQGYTRLRPGAVPRTMVAPPTIRVSLSSPDRNQPLPQNGETWHLPPDMHAFAPTLRIVDHAEDTPPGCSLILRDADGAEITRSDGPVLSVPGPGRFALLAAIADGHESREQHLGWIEAPRASRHWLPALAIGAIGVLGSALAWSLRTRRLRRNLQGRRVANVLAASTEPAEQVLDLAFLAVAAAEECAEITAASHASVWLHASEQGARILLADFGGACPDATARLHACCATGKTMEDLGWRIDSKRGTDLALCLRGAGTMEFELLLTPATPPTAATIEELRRALAPLQAGLRKQAWIQRLETNFAHNAAHLHASLHDLRGSLTSLRLGAFMLAGDQRPVMELQPAAKALASAAEQVLGRVEGLMADLQPTQGVNLRPADPCPMVRSVVQALLARAAAKQITVELLLPITGPQLLLDEQWFPRVIDNLVGNAIKYSPRGSTVRVTGARQEDGGFLLEVVDAGPGFARDELDAVFLPGAIGSAKPTGGESQEGLGLWIARQAARAMGGRLWVASTSATGSRLSLWLPVAEPQAKP